MQNLMLSGTGSTDIYAGSLLDDNQWHDVDIIRESKECNITIDRLKTIGKLGGEFLNLDVDSMVNCSQIHLVISIFWEKLNLIWLLQELLLD